MNYAAMYPEINYIQGMSDLLAPLLNTIRDEAATYWCFVGLMQQTLFSSAPGSENNMMDVNLVQTLNFKPTNNFSAFKITGLLERFIEFIGPKFLCIC